MFKHSSLFRGTSTFAATLALTATAAAVTQTNGDGTPLPQPVGANELQLMVSWGFNEAQDVNSDFLGGNLNPPVKYGELCRTVMVPGCPRTFPVFNGVAPPNTGENDAVTLQGLFKWRGEQIDPVKDARIEPGYFSPTCGFSGELVLHGGSCNLKFGWYNVADPNNPVKPAASEIYPLIPSASLGASTIEEFMQCNDQGGNPKAPGEGFCPLAWDNHSPYNPRVQLWTPRSFDSGVIKQDPNYKGGYVAFALIGDPNTQCTDTKYSIAAHNTLGPQGEPWITTLIWQSTVDPEGFYMGFEDLKMDPSDWHKVPGGPNAQNDGDFNDFVYFITGLNCAGGGQPCNTGLQGACSLGRTDCAAEGETPTCRAIIQPGPETCDNVDNDCNGQVDDGDLCPSGEVCDKGKCVQACGSVEFPCASGYTCVSGFCIEDACANVTCDQGQVCRGGDCHTACDSSVVCPAGQECQLGRCVDPCAGVTCPTGRVCERGLCVSDCSCRGCPDGYECGSDGRCSDPKCVGVTCPDGLVCKLGDCVDPCEGVACPGGGRCVGGTCTDPTGAGGVGAGGAPLFSQGGLANGGSGNSGINPNRALADNATCACRVTTARDPDLAWLGLLAAAGLLRRRRRAIGSR